MYFSFYELQKKQPINKQTQNQQQVGKFFMTKMCFFYTIISFIAKWIKKQTYCWDCCSVGFFHLVVELQMWWAQAQLRN